MARLPIFQNECIIPHFKTIRHALSMLKYLMQGKTLKIALPFVLIFAVFVGSYIWFLDTKYFLALQATAQENFLSFIFLLFLVKTLSIVWPPLPGGLFTLGSIPLVGWEAAYFVDFAGSILGSTITFYLGKRYGLPLLKKLFDSSIIERINKIKVKNNRQTELVIVLRVFTGSIFMEAITYGAGILKLRYSSFLVGSVVSHVVVGVPTYYFAEQALISPTNLVGSGIVLILVFYVLYKVKGRYFE